MPLLEAFCMRYMHAKCIISSSTMRKFIRNTEMQQAERCEAPLIVRFASKMPATPFTNFSSNLSDFHVKTILRICFIDISAHQCQQKMVRAKDVITAHINRFQNLTFLY